MLTTSFIGVFWAGGYYSSYLIVCLYYCLLYENSFSGQCKTFISLPPSFPLDNDSSTTRRMTYIILQENGLLHVPKGQAQNAQAQMFSDPNMAMDMMKNNLTMIIPQVCQLHKPCLNACDQAKSDI